MPTQMFNIASTLDDATIYVDDTVYPPTAAPSFFTSGTSMWRTLSGGIYEVAIALLRWDTSSLPNDSSITGASLTFYPASPTTTDARSLTADWTAWSGVAGDWTATAGTNAHAGTLISTFTNDVQATISLINAATNISLTSYTYLRTHISGGAPTGTNGMYMYETNNASLTPPQLTVSYNLAPTEAASPGKKKRTSTFAI